MVISWWFDGDLMVTDGDFMVISWWFDGDLMVTDGDFMVPPSPRLRRPKDLPVAPSPSPPTFY